MKLMKTIRKLCTPAYVYLVISVIAIVAMMIQNGGNENEFCIGSYRCDVESKAAIFVGQGLYTAFWVFVLNSICKSGYKNISWFLVLLPYILMFIMLGMVVLENQREGFKEGQDDDDHKDRKKGWHHKDECKNPIHYYATEDACKKTLKKKDD